MERFWNFWRIFKKNCYPISVQSLILVCEFEQKLNIIKFAAKYLIDCQLVIDSVKKNHEASETNFCRNLHNSILPHGSLFRNSFLFRTNQLIEKIIKLWNKVQILTYKNFALKKHPNNIKHFKKISGEWRSKERDKTSGISRW